jgi:hypothetical protein
MIGARWVLIGRPRREGELTMAVMTEDDRMQAAWVELRERLIGARSGNVAVTDVRIKLYDYLLEGFLVESTNVDLVLSDPPHPETWPWENTQELRERAHQEAAQLGITPQVKVYLTTRPGYDDEVYGPEEE